MRICLDTNVLVKLFGASAPYNAIQQALFAGRLELAFSNEMFLEYEETVTRLTGSAYWQRVAALLEQLGRSQGIVVQVAPTFRFWITVVDPDDNKFVDCAIVAGADFIVTEDRHFDVLRGTGYRPQPIMPEEFIRLHLAPE